MEIEASQVALSTNKSNLVFGVTEGNSARVSDKADETDAFERDLGNIGTAARAVEIYENDVTNSTR